MAHPRSRGENGNCTTYVHYQAGSSPLTRGKPNVVQEGANAGGLIPAHAGKTQVDNAHPPHYWAHPRSRGENLP